jgi:hypothetical protein
MGALYAIAIEAAIEVLDVGPGMGGLHNGSRGRVISYYPGVEMELWKSLV